MKKTIDGLQVSGITDDSRKVGRDFLFVAVKGIKTDGHKHINEAIKNGASVVIGEEDPTKLPIPADVIYKQVSDSKKALGLAASEWFGNPSEKLKVIGVTGTDGKTTTASLIYWILKNSGKKVGLVSTVSAIIGERQYDTGFHVTNPDAIALQGFLAEMVKEGCEYAVLEVTSHGIAQERIAGISFYMAVLTNITHEHLDYHKNFEAYRDTKLSLLKRAKFVVLNDDDANFSFLSDKLKSLKVLSYSSNEKNLDLASIPAELTAKYNIANMQAAACATLELGISHDSMAKALKSFKLPKGRLEKMEIDRDFDIYIDFAHTPNALEKALTYLKTKTKGRLIAVFGSAGERDVAKRPLMGKAASQLADIVILTAEDPRGEDVEGINIQIKGGFDKEVEVYSVPDRQEAIELAFKLAKKDDVIGIFGKGHEGSMNFDGKTETIWSDHKAVEKAAKILNN